MKKLIVFLLLVISAFQTKSQQGFAVALPATVKEPLDGRLLLLIAKTNQSEPRFQVSDGAGSQMVFGMDVENWKAGEIRIFSSKEFGYPIQSLKDIPPGEYYVQALLHKYETFHRKDGHVVKLPMDRGEGQQWNQAPGNIYSKPVKVTITAGGHASSRLALTETIPPIKEPEDTKYIKHIRIQSKLLTEFWGKPFYIGAHILLPEGWDEHANVKYPLAIFHGHFPSNFSGFSTTPPDTASMKPDYSERFHISGYNRIVAQEAYDFYKTWTAPNYPRVIAIEIQHANPYYDDSYAVNSENLGPYGDAITYELIPEIEKKFRGIGQGWARFMYGGSTGGWEVLAAQVFYPDEYNGCYAACPDPIDFRAYTVVDLYKDKNAYFLTSDFKKTPRPAERDSLGHVFATLQEVNYRELALGTHSRSGQQWDIWEAVYSPVGKDGYPQRIWDKVTGNIDSNVAAYWKEHFDLSYIMKRDWAKLGPKLKGKVHIYCGDMDTYYLNNAVYFTEATLKSLANPTYDGVVDYGDRAEHCWNGDHTQPNYISRLRYHQMFIARWVAEVQNRAPAGVDLKSWRY